MTLVVEDIGPAMMRVMCEQLRAHGYEVERSRPLEVTVSNVERMAPDQYRGDVDVLVPRFGRVIIRRVYVQMVSDGTQSWIIKWPRRHEEGSPFGWNARWVTTASMGGQLADAVKDALIAAVLAHAADKRP